MSGDDIEGLCPESDIASDERVARALQEELDLQRYDSNNDSDEDEDRDEYQYVTLEDDQLESQSSFKTPFPKAIELESIKLDCGTISVGDTVELKDHTNRESSNPLSGDFLRVRSIIEDLETEDLVLRGQRLRRNAYLSFFDQKLNELFWLIEVDEDDTRSLMEKGMVDIPVEEVIGKRDCTFTKSTYPSQSFRRSAFTLPENIKTKPEAQRYIFDHGPLIVRFINIVYLHKNGKSYGGEVRRLYKRECDAQLPPTDDSCAIIEPKAKSAGKRRLSSDSLEEVSETAIKRRPVLPTKAKRFTFGDGFCGCGGTSQGARQAGLDVVWGLDNDETAMRAYQMNFPGATHLEINANEFKSVPKFFVHGVDLMHMSCPCCFWSEAHTNPGKDDHENREAILNVGPWLNHVRPRMLQLEQAPGLLKLEKHKLWFRKLINEIINAGYNVRYKIMDLSTITLHQRRRRLVFLGAQQGIPLPPFPKPTHGPEGSGLKRFNTIGDMLESIKRLGPHVENDPYHQPQNEKVRNGRGSDPSRVARCITTKGGDDLHPSGLRGFTVREISGLQGFNLDFQFAGTKTEALKQAGNAFGPNVAEKYILSSAQTLEAFDHGFIDAEDDIDDLWDFLAAKGIKLPLVPSTPNDSFGSSSSSRSTREGSRFRYLSRLEKTVQPKKKHSLWGRNYEVKPLTPKRENKMPSQFFGLYDGTDARSSPTPHRSEKRRTEIVEVDGYFVELD